MDNNISIAFIGGRGLNSNYGGVENAIREISKCLVSYSDTEITVYGTREDSPSLVNKTETIKQVNMPRFVYDKGGQHLLTFFCVANAIFKRKNKIIFLFASGPCIFTPLLKLFGFKVVANIRAVDSQRDKWGVISRKILEYGERFACRYAHAMTVNSKEMRDYFIDARPDVYYVPNGATYKEVGNDGELYFQQTLLKQKGYLFFAARLDPVKRAHLMIEAYNELDTNVPLVIAGGHCKDPDYQRQLQQMASDNVIFLGHVSQEQVEVLIKNCMIFISPSVLEGMSNSILSAMLNSVPVIAADVRANSDLLEDKRAIFESDNVISLRSKMSELLQDSDQRNVLGASLKRHVLANYTWDNTARKFYEIAKCL